MQLEMPKPIAAYFAADEKNGEAVARCFTENATVKDEGHTYEGRSAIEQWKDAASAKFQYTCEPFACGRENGQVIVTSRLTGNFPGSPADLRFIFKIEGAEIASLEVAP